MNPREPSPNESLPTEPVLPEPGDGVIGIRTAVILYSLLAVFAFVTLKGTPLYFSLLIVLALAAKSYVHYLRSRLP